MAIISASRRTDIPAFFSDWFMNRIREGYFLRMNPFNANQVKRVSLAPADVDAVIFWSKNPRPLMAHLDELDSRGYRYYFQYTLNPYGPVFEPHVPGLDERLDTFRDLADRVGAKRVVWRCDPVILSSDTPVDRLLERIASLAEGLAGRTARLVFSFLDFYATVDTRLKELEKRHGIRLYDMAGADRHGEALRFAAGLKRIGAEYGMEVLSCAEKTDLGGAGIGHGSCIDGELIRELFGIDTVFTRDRNQRRECLCVESVDTGMYSTCRFRCAYCYANATEKTVLANLARHDPKSDRLIGADTGPVEVGTETGKRPALWEQQRLFGK
jgi:DNA repair photolyase